MFEPDHKLPDFSSDQVSAWQKVTARLATYGVDLQAGTTTPRDERETPCEVMAVTGKAGSGKTVLLAGLAHRLRESGLSPVMPDREPRRSGRSFAVLAPTNKAASVLRARGVPATTIHRIAYSPVYAPEYEKLAEWLAGERTTRPEIEGLAEVALERAMAFYRQHESIAGAFAAAGLRGADFITGWKRRAEPLDVALIDEASMLDAARLDDLKEIFGLIVLFGDPAQLAPVMGAGVGRARMVFANLPEGRCLSLSRIHRQAADSPILDLAHLLGEPGLEFSEFETELQRVAQRDDRVVVAPRVDADLMRTSPVLVWRNRTRIRLINGFRQVHGCPEMALLPGEPLVCDGLELPLKRRKQRLELEAHGLIRGAQATYLGPGRKPGFARVDIHGMDEPGISVASIIQVESPEEEEPRIITAARSGALFLHGASVTIHKSQGSQWPEVQIFAPDLFAAARAGQEEAGIALWKRLAYVAVTRASERLIWATRWVMSKPAEPLSGQADEPG